MLTIPDLAYLNSTYGFSGYTAQQVQDTLLFEAQIIGPNFGSNWNGNFGGRQEFLDRAVMGGTIARGYELSSIFEARRSHLPRGCYGQALAYGGILPQFLFIDWFETSDGLRLMQIAQENWIANGRPFVDISP